MIIKSHKLKNITSSPFVKWKQENHTDKCLLKEILYRKQKGECYYCKCKTEFPIKGGNNSNPLVATLEHLYHVWDIRRALAVFGDCVIACNKCNNDLGNKINEELWEEWNQYKDFKLW
jgi:hypothetical protein